MPFFQGFPDEVFAPLEGAIVIESKQFSGSSEDIVTLFCAVPLARALGSHCTEEFSRGILATAVIPVVVGGRDEVFPQGADDVRIREARQPVAHAIVSCAPERMPVHFPEVNWFTGGGRVDPCLPKAGAPGNFPPLEFLCGGLHQGVQSIEIAAVHCRGCDSRRGESKQRDDTYSHGESLSSYES